MANEIKVKISRKQKRRILKAKIAQLSSKYGVTEKQIKDLNVV